MYRCHHLDAYFLSCQNVDSWLATTEETVAAPAHSVQQGNPLGYNGHGFHEP